MRRLFYLILCLFFFTNVVFAGDVEDGVVALNNGNDKKAVKLFSNTCDKGELAGCNNLGIMYENGQGVKQRIKVALKYFGLACDMKNKDGCDNYAKLNK